MLKTAAFLPPGTSSSGTNIPQGPQSSPDLLDILELILNLESSSSSECVSTTSRFAAAAAAVAGMSQARADEHSNFLFESATASVCGAAGRAASGFDPISGGMGDGDSFFDSTAAGGSEGPSAVSGIASGIASALAALARSAGVIGPGGMMMETAGLSAATQVVAYDPIVAAARERHVLVTRMVLEVRNHVRRIPHFRHIPQSSAGISGMSFVSDPLISTLARHHEACSANLVSIVVRLILSIALANVFKHVTLNAARAAAAGRNADGTGDTGALGGLGALLLAGAGTNPDGSARGGRTMQLDAATIQSLLLPVTAPVHGSNTGGNSCSICLSPFSGGHGGHRSFESDPRPGSEDLAPPRTSAQGRDEGDTISCLPCDRRHVFHTECIEAWLSRSNSCPLCQRVLVS